MPSHTTRSEQANVSTTEQSLTRARPLSPAVVDIDSDDEQEDHEDDDGFDEEVWEYEVGE